MARLRQTIGAYRQHHVHVLMPLAGCQAADAQCCPLSDGSLQQCSPPQTTPTAADVAQGLQGTAAVQPPAVQQNDSGSAGVGDAVPHERGGVPQLVASGELHPHTKQRGPQVANKEGPACC